MADEVKVDVKEDPTKSSSSEEGKDAGTGVTSVEEPVDEHGVPWKNRVAEGKRKLEEAERKNQELAQAVIAMQSSKATESRPDEGKTPTFQELWNDGRYEEATELKATQKAKQEREALLSELIVKEEKAKAADVVFNRYPDIANVDSEFFKETQRVYVERNRTDAYAALDAANEAARRLEAKGVKFKIGNPSTSYGEYNRQRASEGARLEEGHEGHAESTGYSLTEKEKRLAPIYGISGKEAAKLIADLKKERGEL